MKGISRKTGIITLRLPNDVIETIVRRARKNNISAYEYLRDRVIYDFRRRHNKGREIEINVDGK